MPTIRNETGTILLIPGGEANGKTMRFSPGEKRKVETLNEALKKAEGQNLIRVLPDGGQEKSGESAKPHDGQKQPDGQKPPENQNPQDNQRPQNQQQRDKRGN